MAGATSNSRVVEWLSCGFWAVMDLMDRSQTLARHPRLACSDQAKLQSPLFCVANVSVSLLQ